MIILHLLPSSQLVLDMEMCHSDLLSRAPVGTGDGQPIASTTVIYHLPFIQLPVEPDTNTERAWIQSTGVRLIFTRGHISLAVAFKGLNVIL